MPLERRADYSITALDAEVIDGQASRLMQEGLRLLAAGADLAEPLRCFDEARELRSRLPLDRVPRFRYGLAACWLNRAEALMRSADAAQLADALRASDEALALLETLPLEEDARFVKRLAIARVDRGLLLERLGQAEEAAPVFDSAVALLDSPAAADVPERSYLLAVACANLANARASRGMSDLPTPARDAARRALDAVSGDEEADAGAADAGLLARHVLCRLIATTLARGDTRVSPIPDEVHEGTDLVDEALGIVRAWEQQGVTRFRPLARDFLTFGALLYSRYQPQFLQEFLEEALDPARSSPAFVGSEAVQSAVRAVLAGGDHEPGS